MQTMHQTLCLTVEMARRKRKKTLLILTAAVGWLEGTAVGAAVVGDAVGDAVVGDAVGLLEGSAVGCI